MVMVMLILISGRREFRWWWMRQQSVVFDSDARLQVWQLSPSVYSLDMGLLQYAGEMEPSERVELGCQGGLIAGCSVGEAV